MDFLKLFGLSVYQLHKFIQNLIDVIQNVLIFCEKFTPKLNCSLYLLTLMVFLNLFWSMVNFSVQLQNCEQGLRLPGSNKNKVS